MLQNHSPAGPKQKAALKEYDAAEKDFGEALSKNPGFCAGAHRPRRNVAGTGGNELALADFQQALEHDRSNPRILFGLGKAYVLLGGGEQGIRPLTRHLAVEGETDERRAESYRLRAEGYAALRQVSGGYEDIEESLKIRPDDYETFAILAVILYRQENLLGAAKAISVAIDKYVPDEENPQPYIQGYLTKASILVDLAKQVPGEDVRFQVYRGRDRRLQSIASSKWAKPRNMRPPARRPCLAGAWRFGCKAGSRTPSPACPLRSN